MFYPAIILPNEAFKSIDCDLSDYFLIRFIEADNIDQIWDYETNTIKVQSICSPPERIDDLSLSLLGIYKEEHIILQFTREGIEKYMHYCDPDEMVAMPVYETDYILKENRRYWCAPINRLNEREFEYTREEESFIAKCFVLHTPMRWNFWHFSLRWSTNLGTLDSLEEKLRKKVAKRIGHSARSVIAQFATITIPPHPILPKECYYKN
jgi:hypothetical protein